MVGTRAAHSMSIAVIGTITGRLKMNATPVNTTTKACENFARWVSTRSMTAFVVVSIWVCSSRVKVERDIFSQRKQQLFEVGYSSIVSIRISRVQTKE